MKIREVMSKAPLAISPDARLLDAAELMLTAEVSALPVMSEDRLVGILTEGDLLRRWETETDRRYPGFAVVKVGVERMAADFVRSHGGYVRELMATQVVSVEEDASVEEAIRLFEQYGFKQLPVTRQGKLSGIMTRRNILEAFVASSRRMSAGEHDDEEIKRSLLAIYMREPWAPLDRIDVRVTNGIVEIVGGIETENQRKAIIAAAEGVPGVKGVVDVMVKVGESQGRPNPIGPDAMDSGQRRDTKPRDH